MPDALDTPIYRLPPYTVEATFIQLAQTVDWGLTNNGIPELWKQSAGKGIRVAVLDTGIDESHPDLQDCIDEAKDFTGSHAGPADLQGHGSHVAGIIGARNNAVGVVGVAPECRLIIGKVLGDDGSGSDRSVAAGIDWARDMGADVISMSLGSPSPSPTIYAAIKRAFLAGKFLIVAAGNDGRPNSVNYPGRWPETIAVGAVDRNGRVAQFSSQGPEVAIAAPGQDVLSTYRSGSYAKLSGTSMATPFVAGAVALMLSKDRQAGGPPPITNNTQLKEHLAKTAKDAGPQGRDPAYGWGLIDPSSMLGPAAEPEVPTPVPARGGVWVFIPGGKVVPELV